jgi:electron transfer flavoprotein beta subunit
MNPFDELSIEESVRIREKKSYAGGVEEIIALSIGPPKSVDVLRTAMAMGADRSIFVEVKDGEEVEPLAVGKIIRRLVEKEVCKLSLFPGLVGWAKRGVSRGEMNADVRLGRKSIW